MYQKDVCFRMDLSPHSPHNIIPTLIKKGSVILDVGCNTGFLGKQLKDKDVITDGIDINERALKLAKKYYRNTYKKDLYQGKLGIPNKYDYIIFADILEHLPRPDLLLIDSQKYLHKNGKIIISLPNIARFEIRMKLLFGNFDYSPGILGEDHLRFYTRKSAIEMIRKCGYEVIKIIPTGLGHMLQIFPTLTAFQFIYVCRK